MARKMMTGSPGLWTAPNAELAPPGALKQALGTVMRRPGMLEKARPFKQYSYYGDSAMSGSFVALGYYGSLYFAKTAAGALWAETGIGSAILAAETLPASFLSGVRSADVADNASIRAFESNGNWFIATSSGIMKFDSASGTPYRAGAPRGLDLQLSLVASGSLLATNQVVGYRICFGILDANKNLVLGPPSGRATITATAAQNVGVKAFLPADISGVANATSYFYQVYRTTVASSGIDPGDEMQLVYQAQITATDVSIGFVQFTDFTADGLRGASLYTSPSQGGIAANANYQPPIAQDVALFRGSAFYANTAGKHRASLQMLGIPEQWSIQSIAANTPIAGQSTYVFTVAFDTTGINNTMKLAVTGTTGGSNDGTWAVVSSTPASVVVSNAGVAQAGLAGTAMSGKLTINAVDFYPVFSAENVGSRYFQVTTSFTSSTNVAITCASLLRIVNQQTGASAVCGYYMSGPDDGAGLLQFEERGLGGASFSISALGTTTAAYQGAIYNKFSPTIPTTAPVNSTNDAAVHRVYYTPANQPEHLHLGQYFDIGSRAAAILRVVALRDSLIVFKKDGLFRIVGDAGVFSVQPFDLTLILTRKTAVAQLANRLFAMTTKGLYEISDNGAFAIDDNIADRLRANIENVVFGSGGIINVFANEIDGVLYVFTSTSTTTCFTYSTRTNSWTEQYVSSAQGDSVGQVPFVTLAFCAVSGMPSVIDALGNIYVSDTVNFADPASYGAGAPVPAHKYLVNITAVNVGAKTITATGLAGPALAVGGVLIYGAGFLWVITAVAGSVYTLAAYSVSPSFTFAIGRTYQYAPQPSLIEWLPFTAGDDALNDRFLEVTVLSDGASTVDTCTIKTFTEQDPTIRTAAAYPQAPSVAVASTNFIATVPQTQQFARRLSVQFQHAKAAQSMFVRALSITYNESEEDRSLS